MSNQDNSKCVCCDFTTPLADSSAQPAATETPASTQTRRRFLQTAAASTVGAAVTGVAGPLAGQAAAAPSSRRGKRTGRRRPTPSVVIANRGSGDITVIDSDTLSTSTVTLPGNAEPMYVNHDPRNGRVLVGDRASSTVVAFDDKSYSVVGTVDVGSGVFHQWLDVRRGRLWVVGTEASTVTVVDSNDLEAEETFAIPDDLIKRGGVTHDVFVAGPRAFVSVLGLDDGSGAVLQYSTRTLNLTGRIETGGDPHLFVHGGVLYVPSQDAGTVTAYGAASLRPICQTSIPNAHGIFVTKRNEVFVSNIADGGTDALWSLAGPGLRARRDPIDTAVPVPHNIGVTKSGIVYITHSGPTANAVSVINPHSGQSDIVTAGTNPFGLAVVD